MFFNYYCNLFLFCIAINFITIIRASENLEPETEHPSRKMDDLKSFTWNTYCKFQKNERRCGPDPISQRYYFYDVKLHACNRFNYGGCNNSYNLFNSLHDCKSRCQGVSNLATYTNVTENVYCRFQPEFGSCNSYYPMWYFDVSDMRCKGFSFSGCGGNNNRFDTPNKCLTVCSAVVK